MIKLENFKEVMSKAYDGLYSVKVLAKQMIPVAGIILIINYKQYVSFNDFLLNLVIILLMVVLVIAIERIFLKLLLRFKYNNLSKLFLEEEIGHYTFQNKSLIIKESSLQLLKINSRKQLLVEYNFSDLTNAIMQLDTRKSFFNDFSKLQKYFITIETKTARKQTFFVFTDENTEKILKDQFKKMTQKIK